MMDIKRVAKAIEREIQEIESMAGDRSFPAIKYGVSSFFTFGSGKASYDVIRIHGGYRTNVSLWNCTDIDEAKDVVYLANKAYEDALNYWRSKQS
jgi:hypothetical protein